MLLFDTTGEWLRNSRHPIPSAMVDISDRIIAKMFENATNDSDDSDTLLRSLQMMQHQEVLIPSLYMLKYAEVNFGQNQKLKSIRPMDVKMMFFDEHPIEFIDAIDFINALDVDKGYLDEKVVSFYQFHKLLSLLLRISLCKANTEAQWRHLQCRVVSIVRSCEFQLAALKRRFEINDTPLVNIIHNTVTYVLGLSKDKLTQEVVLTQLYKYTYGLFTLYNQLFNHNTAFEKAVLDYIYKRIK